MKNFREKKRGRIQGLPKFFRYPLLSQERENYGFQIWPKRERGRIHATAHFWVPRIISGTGKATKFKFCMHIYRLNRNKSPLKISGKVAVGVVRDSRKFSGHPYNGAHRAVIFAIAQLSCYPCVFSFFRIDISTRAFSGLITAYACVCVAHYPLRNRTL